MCKFLIPHLLVNVSKQHSYTKPSEEYLMLILKVLHFPRKTIICFEVAIIGNRAQTSGRRNWSIKWKTITHPIAEKKNVFCFTNIYVYSFKMQKNKAWEIIHLQMIKRYKSILCFL